jgi:hypothetical protein
MISSPDHLKNLDSIQPFREKPKSFLQQHTLYSEAECLSYKCLLWKLQYKDLFMKGNLCESLGLSVHCLTYVLIHINNCLDGDN